MDVQEWKNVFYLYNRSTWPVISAVLQIYTEWVLFKFTCFYKYLIFICGYSMMQIYRFIYIYTYPRYKYVTTYSHIYIYISHHHPSGSISPIQGSGLGTLDAVGQVEIRYVRSPDDLTVGCFAESTCCWWKRWKKWERTKTVENEDKVDFCFFFWGGGVNLIIKTFLSVH